MGISRLGKAIKKFSPNGARIVESAQKYRGMRAAIDSAIFVYKFKAVGYDVAQAFKEQVKTFETLGIAPHYFFDGHPCEAKMVNIRGRRQKRRDDAAQLKESVAKLESFRRKDISALANPLASIVAAEESVGAQRRRMSTVPTGEDYRRAKAQLASLGVPVYQCKHDGEKGCAWACKTGIADFVVSEDLDCVPYGAPLLVTNWGKPTMTEYNLGIILDEFGSWTQKMMIDYCILLGSDLCPLRIKGIGPVLAHRLISSHRCIEGVVATVDRKRYAVPDYFPYGAARKEFADPSPQGTDVAEKFLRSAK